MGAILFTISNRIAIILLAQYSKSALDTSNYRQLLPLALECDAIINLAWDSNDDNSQSGHKAIIEIPTITQWRRMHMRPLNNRLSQEL